MTPPRLSAVLVLAAALAGCGEPVTKGDIWDREAADDASRCAKQYLGRPNSGPDEEIWIMCTQIAAKQKSRPVARVANRVAIKQGKNVFEPGSGRDLSAAMVARLESGQ